MYRDTALRMVAFADELQKEASLSSIINAVRGAAPTRHMAGFIRKHAPGQLGQLGWGALAGGITGGALDEKNRVRGALIGAGLGTGAAGARILASPIERARAAESMRNLGTRMKYRFTGRGIKTPEEAQAVGLMGKAPTAGEIAEAEARATAEQRPKVTKAFEKKQRAHELEETAFGAGEYSIPGTFRSMASQPGEFFKRQWHRTGGAAPYLGKGMAALSAYQAGKELSRKGEPGEGGRFSRAGREIGSGVGWLASPLGFWPGLAVAPALGFAGKTLGKGLDVAFKTKPPAAPAGELAPPTPPEGGV